MREAAKRAFIVLFALWGVSGVGLVGVYVVAAGAWDQLLLVAIAPVVILESPMALRRWLDRRATTGD